ncbi:D-glycero-beta-D-manno-heptose-7-phosphate kinase [Persephonella atlantica]|uniref:D-glycero-beta-D-manno-heptose-7-phosphate kinase n=1 Tax=Persephonella atlantica TaxID=2699429 RepID=A0ABS1GGM8_9AQUI|nr:D-glycero-beta-D-manno-heptose-7-phosphate kinase [Persephonella atlantica]MBK3332077.1 D-glycero-beta-D-manno-heptose-7-phosphate kinase [Persephonella atlantica]
MIKKKRAEEIITQFKNKKILVVGDLILDRYLWGEVERISPEAPVPVVDIKKETFNPGGASNVAWNVSQLGAEVFMSGVVGKDEPGKLLTSLIEEKNIKPLIVLDRERPTTEKTRIIAVSQQLLRIDREKRINLSPSVSSELINQIKSVLKEINAVIVSDYGKGVITKALMDFLKSTKIPVFVDPKPSNFLLYKNITTMTPNRKEAYECVKMDRDTTVEEVGRQIMEHLGIDTLLITLGAEGMALFEKETVTKIPAKAKKVFDVTGAGDTVISVLTLSKISGASWKEAASLANYAAGYVVGEIGTATVSPEKLLELVPE